MEFKEITAKTVDEAITKACLEFETSSDNLEIQVVQEGKYVSYSGDISRNVIDYLVQSQQNRHLNQQLYAASCWRYTIFLIYSTDLRSKKRIYRTDRKDHVCRWIWQYHQPVLNRQQDHNDRNLSQYRIRQT